jgi:hypothetical protein
MKNPFKKSHQLPFSEIHEYTQDLQRITVLRDKAHDDSERVEYTNIIKCMQKALLFLNKVKD